MKMGVPDQVRAEETGRLAVVPSTKKPTRAGSVCSAHCTRLREPRAFRRASINRPAQDLPRFTTLPLTVRLFQGVI